MNRPARKAAPGEPAATPPTTPPRFTPGPTEPLDVHWRELADAAWLGSYWAEAGRPTSPDGERVEGGTHRVPQDEPRPAPPPRDVRRRTPDSSSDEFEDEDHTGDAPDPPRIRPDPRGNLVLPLPPLRTAGQAGHTFDPYGRAVSGPPAATAPGTGLPGLAWALRRLARRRPSAHCWELDEERTAENILSGAAWLPATRPAPERSLDLVILTDTAPTMHVWRRQLRMLAEQTALSGAFRDVRSVGLLLPSDGSAAVLVRADGRRAAPAELLDARGERAFLLVTDGLADGWASAAADRLLTLLGEAGPCAVVHLLPTHLRHRSALRPFPTTLAGGGFGRANTSLGQVLDDDLAEPSPAVVGGPLLAPVLSLKPGSLSSWADLVAGGAGDTLRCMAVQAGTLVKEPPAPGMRCTTSDPESAVRAFTTLATPTARRLASQLAAVPLAADTMLAVQRAMLPEAGPEHLAEIFMGGLLEWPGRHGGTFDFADGVREALLAGGTRSELAAIVSHLAELPPGRPDPQAVRLRAALSNPELEPLPDPRGPDQAWLRLEMAVLEALSGPHGRRARRIREELHRSSSSPDEPHVPYSPYVDVSSRPPVVKGSAMAREPYGPAGGRHGSPGIKGPLPPRNQHFIGREDLLDAVADQLGRGEMAAVLPHTLHGTGGVGKSQIAIEYVYRHQHEFDVVWWVSAEQQSMVLAAFADLARALGIPVGPQPGTAVPRVLEALGDGDQHGRWLLVFDNAEDVEGIRPYLPTSGKGKVIITSRNRDWEGVATSLTVDVFRREESRSLLMRRSPTLSPEDADRLAEALGDLPLAVELAAAWHAASATPVDTYLELLGRRGTEIDAQGLVRDYPATVAAAWRITLDHLRAESNGAYQLLGICGCLAAEPVPLSIFRGGGRVSVSRELDPILREPIRLSRAIRELSKFSLVRIDHRRDAIQMHRLMQTVLRATTEQAERARLLEGAHALLAAAKPAGTPSSPGHWDGYKALLPHAVTSHAAANLDDWVRDLIIGLVFYLYYWGDHEQADDLAGEAWQHWNNDDVPDVRLIEMAKLYAFCQRILGHEESAFDLNERALHAARTAPVPEETLIDSMWQMAGAHRYRSDVATAVALDQEAFDRARPLFGPDDPETLKAAHSLAVSLRMAGRFPEARELDEDTVSQWELVYGHADGFTLNTRNGLSIDIRECGHYPDSRRHQEDVYAAYRAAFGSENPATLRAAGNLAVCRRRDGAPDAAWELSDTTYALLSAKSGSDHSDTLATAINLTVDRRIGGDLRGALALGTDTAERHHRTLGPRHLHTLLALANLAAVHRAHHDHVRAAELDDLALEHLTATAGPDHPFTLTVQAARATDLHLAADHRAAADLQSHLLTRMSTVCGPDHPVTLAVHANLATDLRALGRTGQADLHHTAAVDGLARALGSGHDWLLAARDERRIECDTAPMPL